ncbi:MAG: hypothetical protein QXK80_03175 [Candidatus Pacearchaeota archaeon]
MNKRGVTVQSMLIGIIIVLLIAAIIFFFLKALPYKETVDKEACRNSVILRNNAILRGEGMLPETIPLNCKTQEITISSTNEDFIKREIANAMYDCWWMLGEGKMQFFSESGWREWGVPGKGTAKANCIICSIIRFDEKAKRKQIDLLSFLERTKIPSKNLTYLEYFSQEEKAELPTEIKIEKLDTNQDYAIIFMSIKGEDLGEEIKNYIGLGGTSAFFVPRLLAKGLTKIGVKSAVKLIPVIGWIMATAEAAGHVITFLTSGHAAAVHCEGERKGCNAIILTPLTAQDVVANCQNIESIP